MKKYHITFLALSFGVFLNAQTLQDAITKTDNERFEAAAADFRAIIAKDAGKGPHTGGGTGNAARLALSCYKVYHNGPVAERCSRQGCGKGV